MRGSSLVRQYQLFGKGTVWDGLIWLKANLLKAVSTHVGALLAVAFPFTPGPVPGKELQVSSYFAGISQAWDLSIYTNYVSPKGYGIAHLVERWTSVARVSPWVKLLVPGSVINEYHQLCRISYHKYSNDTGGRRQPKTRPYHQKSYLPFSSEAP